MKLTPGVAVIVSFLELGSQILDEDRCNVSDKHNKLINKEIDYSKKVLKYRPSGTVFITVINSICCFKAYNFPSSLIICERIEAYH
jgi:hypothetical protein